MTEDLINSLEKTTNNLIKVVFVHAFDATVNRPSVVPFGAWATVGNQKSVIIIKEARSKSKGYAQQDIGYNIQNAGYRQHYDVSNSQYDDLFGKDKWEKIWLEFDDFQNWKKDRELIVDENASDRQEASWKRTGHR